MQVSWIDADRIKALVAQILPQEAAVKEAPSIMEIDTTAETLPREAWGFATDWMEPVVKKPAPAAVYTEAPFAEIELPPPPPPPPQAEAEDETDEDHHDHALPNEAAALPLSRIRDKLRAIRQRASEAGILTRPSEVAPPEPVAEAAPVAVESDQSQEAADSALKMEAAFHAPPSLTPAYDVPEGPREERLAAFAGWARKVLREDSGHILVMSDDGEVLWGGEAKAGLVLSTMMAWGSAIRASAMSACETPQLIHQPLASGNVLTVIPCETDVGTVHAAVAAPEGLSHEQANLLRGALCATMN